MHHFLAIFSKVHEFVQNCVSSARSARFVILALGTTLFSGFEQSSRVFPKQRFQPQMSTFVIFALGAPLFGDFQQSARVLYKIVLSAGGHHVLSIPHWVHHFLAIFSKVYEFVQNRVFSPRSARFVIFSLGAPILKTNFCPHNLS